MIEKETGSGEAGSLRVRAERIARADESNPRAMLSPRQVKQVLHDLRVHQIELEMQNEELRRVQAELEASRERYFDLYDLAPVGYCTLTEKGVVLEANLTASKLLGVDRGDLLQQSLSRFILPEDQDIFYTCRKVLFATGTPQVRELRLVHKEGASFWVRMEATVVQGVEGAPVCHAVMSDITERKQAEEARRAAEEAQQAKEAAAALRESEAFRRRLFDTSTIPIVVMDAVTYRCIDCNPAAAQIYRFPSREDVLGKTPLDISPPVQCDGTPSQEKLRHYIEKVMTEGPAVFEWRHQRPSGEIWDAEIHLMSFQSGQRQLLQLTVQDITERNRARLHDDWRNRILEALATGASLHSCLELLALSVEAEEPESLCSVLLLDEQGKHLLHGTGPSLPEFYNQAIHGSEIGMGVGSCGTAAFTGKRVVVEDISTHPYWVDYRDLAERAHLRSCWSEPIYSSTGQVLGTFAIYHRAPRCPGSEQIQLIQYAANLASVAIERKREESALKQAKETAETANRAKDQFIAVLSHELRTPLTPVLTMVSALQTQQDIPDDLRSDMELIRRNVEIEAALIDDLLDITRISRGKIDLHQESVDVHDCLGTALEICEKEIKEKHQEIRLEFHAAQHHVWADPVRLRQAFWNLLKNAIKFTPYGGQISLHTCNVGERLQVAITDTGIGIEPEAMPRIFNLFEQGEKSKIRQFGGLGLGLNIARSVVELHQGRLTASSKGKNKGATFTVELATIVPVEKAEAPIPLMEPQDRPLRILLVEDHPDTLQVLVKLLKKWGHAVITAESVRMARELLGGQEFDLLISDLGLPDGSGLEIMRHVKEHSGIPGIALSGYGAEDDIRQSEAAGFTSHLVKPISIDALRAAIQQASLSCIN